MKSLLKIVLVAILFLAPTTAMADHGWHGGWGGGWHGGGWGGGWGWHHSDDNGLAGGIIGGAIGSIVGNIFAPAPVVVAPAPVIVAPAPEAVLQPWTPAWYTYCAQRFRSFNAQTGYYTGYDGRPYFCQ